nr:type I restriction enzyme HsdR N-terminal domain-containing protein [Escherichia coli]
MFYNFDFSLLNSKWVKEDTVREELISPLLNALGYSISGNHRIIRSFALPHPYVYIGTKKNNIKIIPDYLLMIDGKHKWILDAKGPSENILSGKNVEQAYSYAIHPEIRASAYALCNGHQIAIFNINKTDPVLIFNLKDLSRNLNELKKYYRHWHSQTHVYLTSNPTSGWLCINLGFRLEILYLSSP